MFFLLYIILVYPFAFYRIRHSLLLLDDLIFFIYCFKPRKDIHQHRHHDAVACQLIQLTVGQAEFIFQLEKLLVRKAHESEALLRMQLANPAVMEDTVPVYHRKAIRRRAVGTEARAVLPDGFPVGVDDGIYAVVLKEDGGMLSLVVAHSRILPGSDAPRRIGEF